jgi:hypothetical protein
VGEQLRQVQSARQQAETHLQQEQSTLKEDQAAFERERSAREEVQGQLQREHTALEEARATLKLRDSQITRLTGDLAQASKEKDAVILELQQVAATARVTLELEKKQVEGELFFQAFAC